MSNTLRDMAATGAALRYRPGFGFYAVVDGTHKALTDTECTKAIKAGDMRPEGRGADQFGVYHFTFKEKSKGKKS